MFSRSLPARLLLIFVGIAIATVLILSITFSMGLRDQWRVNMRPHIVQYLDYVNADIGNPPDVNRARDLAARLPINIYIAGPDLDFSTTGQPLDLRGVTFKADKRKRNRRRWPDNVDIGDLNNRTLLRSQLGEYQVFYELRRRGNRPHRYGVFLVGLAMLGGLLWLCFYLIRRQLKPLQAIGDGVGQMGAGVLAHRIDVTRSDDLGQLATSINYMASDIEQMLDAKRQLLLGISHELRSPLTRARISTELLDESDNRQRILEDLIEMESLITDLLESERLNSRHGVLNRSPVLPVELVHSVVVEAHFDGIGIDDRTSAESVNLDEARVRLLLRNLIGNAVQHGGGASEPPQVLIENDPSDGVVRFIVSDSGPGIAEDDLERLTEPFYRSDPSRNRNTGGFGLGLYLCRLVCEAHGGSLTIVSEPGKGTRITAVLGVASDS